jgi:hypothetical protein
VGDDSAFDTAGFDLYVEENGIPEKDYPAAFALWIADVTGGRVPRFGRCSGEERVDVVIDGDDLYSADAANSTARANAAKEPGRHRVVPGEGNNFGASWAKLPATEETLVATHEDAYS